MTIDADEPVELDEALVWLTLREQAADARTRVDALRERETLIKETLVRLAHDVAHAARLEISIVDSREALAVREVLSVIEAALRVPA